jgi:hypothetical protein
VSDCVSIIRLWTLEFCCLNSADDVEIRLVDRRIQSEVLKGETKVSTEFDVSNDWNYPWNADAQKIPPYGIDLKLDLGI